MEKAVCPICPRHCDLSHPHCPRGQKYKETGMIPERPKHHKHHLQFDKREYQLIMKYLHHAVRVVDSGDISQEVTDEMFTVFSSQEVEQLVDLLEKLSDHWMELAHKNL